MKNINEQCQAKKTNDFITPKRHLYKEIKIQDTSNSWSLIIGIIGVFIIHGIMQQMCWEWRKEQHFSKQNQKSETTPWGGEMYYRPPGGPDESMNKSISID